MIHPAGCGCIECVGQQRPVADAPGDPRIAAAVRSACGGGPGKKECNFPDCLCFEEARAMMVAALAAADDAAWRPMSELPAWHAANPGETEVLCMSADGIRVLWTLHDGWHGGALFVAWMAIPAFVSDVVHAAADAGAAA